MSELKPCPFCDGPATYVTVLKIAGDYAAAVICERCNAKTDFMRANDEEDAKVMAAACWNTRAERTCVLEDIPYEPGRWEGVRCSSCGVTDEDTDLSGNYCPNCGAKVVEP